VKENERYDFDPAEMLVSADRIVEWYSEMGQLVAWLRMMAGEALSDGTRRGQALHRIADRLEAVAQGMWKSTPEPHRLSGRDDR